MDKCDMCEKEQVPKGKRILGLSSEDDCVSLKLRFEVEVVESYAGYKKLCNECIEKLVRTSSIWITIEEKEQ